jgi:hypothetical protein
MFISSYPSTLVSAMSAIRISEAQMHQIALKVGSGDFNGMPEVMSSMTVAHLAHSVALKVLREADEMTKTTLDLLA